MKMYLKRRNDEAAKDSWAAPKTGLVAGLLFPTERLKGTLTDGVSYLPIMRLGAEHHPKATTNGHAEQGNLHSRLGNERLAKLIRERGEGCSIKPTPPITWRIRRHGARN